MVNRYATAAGKKYERDLTNYLRQQAYDVERLRLTGVEDEGDLLLRLTLDDRIVIEAKREKGLNLAGWLGEAETERDNYARHRDLVTGGIGFVVVHARRNHGIGKSYVTTTLDQWLEQVS